jgi:hypothetical protein
MESAVTTRTADRSLSIEHIHESIIGARIMPGLDPGIFLRR